MNILYFLRERTKFIRWFYEVAGGPFCETIQKIESQQPPFDELPYREDSEPPFMAEWAEANLGLEMLGRSCVSMLSASLQLYFTTWETELGVQWAEGERKKAFENGWIHGYRVCFGSMPNVLWDACPVKFNILEDVTLARISDQHPEHIATMHVPHIKGLRHDNQSIFVSAADRTIFSDPDLAAIPWLRPNLHVSSDTLAIAIEEVEALASWLEERLLDVKYLGFRPS
ncbi:MAG: hypothetical protein ACREDV_06700 [Methylocella sp.]